MLRSTTITLVFVGHDRIVRCDVAPRTFEPLAISSQSRPSGVELPGLVDIALRASGQRPGRVWVLATDLWTQRIALGAETTRSLSPEETARTLAFEVESLSGLSALDSEVGFKVLSAESAQREFWVLQAPTWVRDQIDAIVRSAGGRLGGLLHPGGLPQALAQGSKGSAARWMRIEAWPGMIVAVGAAQSGAMRHVVAQADRRSTLWQGETAALARSLGGVVALESLADDGQQQPHLPSDSPGTGPVDLRFDDQATLAHWLSRWAAELSRGAITIPIVRAQKQPLSKGAYVAASVLLAAVAALVVGVDAWLIYGDINRANTDAQRFTQKSTELHSARTRTAVMNKRLDEQRQKVDRIRTELQGGESLVAGYRRRWPNLLAALTEGCPANVVIREITSDTSRSTRIHGISLDAAAANELASTLATRLQSQGWTVSPPRKMVNVTPEGREVCRFVVEVEQIAPQVAPPPGMTAETAATMAR